MSCTFLVTKKFITKIGLKENVIIGKLIPAGTGLKNYKNIEPATVAQFYEY